MKKLFIDDLRMPTYIHENNNDWDIVTNYYDAVKYIKENGIPNIISFDHDLGEGKTAYDFVKWLVFEYDNGKRFPNDFNFMIHSANPVGAENIRCLLNNYLKHTYNKTYK